MTLARILGGFLLVLVQSTALLGECPATAPDVARFVAKIQVAGCDDLSAFAADFLASPSLSPLTRVAVQDADGVVLAGSLIEKVYYDLHTEDDSIYRGTESVSEPGTWYWPDRPGGSCSALLSTKELFLLLSPRCCDHSPPTNVPCALGVDLARKPHSSLLRALGIP